MAVASALSLAACGESQKLCEQADRSCEIGNGKCIVGYNLDCGGGQICYAGDGAPKGKPGVCTDGQFDANGRLVATVVEAYFEQEGRTIGISRANGEYRHYNDCFFICPALDQPCGPGAVLLGTAPATLTVVWAQGPNAEPEQLKVAVHGVEHPGCELVGDSERRQTWKCSFPEANWAGENTREPLELKLWTPSLQTFQWMGRARVDTQPLQLSFKASITENFLKLSEQKTPVGIGANLETVKYLHIELLGNGTDTPLIEEPIRCNYADWLAQACTSPPNCPVSIPFDAEAYGPFPLTVRATVNATDMAGNEVKGLPLTATLSL